MKKVFLSSVFLFLAFLTVFSQQKPKNYQGELIYWEITNFPFSGENKTKMILLFDNRQSTVRLDVSNKNEVNSNSIENLLGNESQTVDAQGRQIQKKTIVVGTPKKISLEETYKIYKNFSTKELYSTGQIVLLGDILAGGSAETENYVIKEDLPNFDWQITQEKKKIEGYECFKAISN